MASKYDIQRRLRRWWREPGNPRLKGLLLASLDHTDARPREVGEAWLTDPSERDRLMQSAGTHRALQAPVSQQYNPGAHEELERRPEAGTARTLARDEWGSDDDVKRFMSGEKSMDKDLYIKRALLNDSVTELDVLYREELETSMIMGAQPKKIFREAANVVNVSKRKGDLPRESDEGYAQILGHSDEIPTGEEGQDTVAYETVKIAQGFEISDALAAEAEPDIVESLARRTGGAVENSVNRLCIVELIDNAGQTFDADVGGTVDATAVQALNGAITNVQDADFPTPDTAVVHAEFEQAIFDDTNVVYANRSGSTQPLQERQMGSIMGLNRWMASDSAYNNAANAKNIRSVSNTYGYANNGEIGGTVFASDLFNLVVWQEFDMDTKDYEDPIRDLSGQNVRTWADAVYGQANAASNIQY